MEARGLMRQEETEIFEEVLNMMPQAVKGETLQQVEHAYIERFQLLEELFQKDALIGLEFFFSELLHPPVVDSSIPATDKVYYEARYQDEIMRYLQTNGQYLTFDQGRLLFYLQLPIARKMAKTR